MSGYVEIGFSLSVVSGCVVIGFLLCGVLGSNLTLDSFTQACCTPHSQNRGKLISHFDLVLLCCTEVLDQIKTSSHLIFLAKPGRLEIHVGQTLCFIYALACRSQTSARFTFCISQDCCQHHTKSPECFIHFSFIFLDRWQCHTVC